MYYARVTFQTDATAIERHEDVGSARKFIEEERDSAPDAFRSGEILERDDPDWKIVATHDETGWHFE